MRSLTRKIMCGVMAVLLAGASVQAAFQLVENFQTMALGSGATGPDGKACTGVMGGTWDTETATTGNVSIQSNSSSVVVAFWRTSGGLGRGVGFNGITNTINDGETGKAFFRFMVLSSAISPVTYIGLISNTTADPITSTYINTPATIPVGFGLLGNGSGGMNLVKTDGTTVLKSGLVRGQWYNTWIVANNAADTFDLYLSTATGPSGAATLPNPGDIIASNVPFGVATSVPLVGMVFGCPNGPASQSVNTYIDEIYWDGDEGLASQYARSPVPANNAANIELGQVLSWLAPNDPNIQEIISYDVYMDPNQTKVATGSSTCAWKSLGQTGTSFDPNPDLSFETQYFWRVATTLIWNNDPNETPVVKEGYVWNFTTRSPAPDITGQPANVVVKETEQAQFTVVVSSPYAPESYQWYTSTDQANNTSADDVLISSGGTLATYTIPSVALTDEKFYYCKVSNTYNSVLRSVYSNAAALAVKRKVAHWTLDNLAGYNDSTPEGHNATPGGTPVFVAGAYPATTGNGVQVNTANGWAWAGTWDPSNYSKQMSFSMWVKWAGQRTPVDYQGLIAKRSTWAADGMMWQMEIINTTASAVRFMNFNYTVTSTVLPQNEWISVIVTFDGTTARIYRNGVLTQSGAFALGTGTGTNMMIGAGGQDPALMPVPNAPFNGVMDDVQIYNYALGASEVAYVYYDASGNPLCVNLNEPLLATYDIDKNCTVDVGDLQMFANEWLSCFIVPDCVERP